jgi:hypothetical protein
MPFNTDDDSSVESSLVDFEEPVHFGDNDDGSSGLLERSMGKYSAESSTESALSERESSMNDDDSSAGDLSDSELPIQSYARPGQPFSTRGLRQIKIPTKHTSQTSPTGAAGAESNPLLSPRGRLMSPRCGLMSPSIVMMSPCGRLMKKGSASSPEMSPHFLKAHKAMRNRNGELSKAELLNSLSSLDASCLLDDSSRS